MRFLMPIKFLTFLPVVQLRFLVETCSLQEKLTSLKFLFFLHLYQAYMGKKSKNKDQSTECFDENYRFRTLEMKNAFVSQREVLH